MSAGLLADDSDLTWFMCWRLQDGVPQAGTVVTSQQKFYTIYVAVRALCAFDPIRCSSGRDCALNWVTHLHFPIQALPNCLPRFLLTGLFLNGDRTIHPPGVLCLARAQDGHSDLSFVLTAFNGQAYMYISNTGQPDRANRNVRTFPSSL